jgi:hypothetical protein
MGDDGSYRQWVHCVQSHFLEISSSMLLFGGIAGWVMYNKRDKVKEQGLQYL